MKRPFIALILMLLVATAGVESATAPAVSSSVAAPRTTQGSCGNGSTTALEYEKSALGRTKFTLRSRAANEVLYTKDFPEEWNCLGFNNGVRAYILAGYWNRGNGMRMQSIVYLYEAGLSHLKPSIFDKREFSALTAVMSPDHRVMAFIGGPHEQTTAALYVMDFAKNKLQKLGKAPAPPPLSDGSSSAWGWNQPNAAYQELDKGILYFPKPHVLHASYGQDSAERRATQRQTKSWILR